MCGLAGICHIRGPGKVSFETLHSMTAALRHRGEDESGIYIDDHIGLGHARLSIIDLTSGTQPIHNEDKTLWIVFNGEIFNYPQLRKELIDDGHQFFTSTDTEVVLHLFERDGLQCLDSLNGQFAFAIWDSMQKQLFLARDRMGICPLHYTIHNGYLYFASEIKSIFMEKKIQREINPIALDQIFTFWAPLPGVTAFKNIHELEPGQFLHLHNGDIKIKKYWHFPVPSRSEHIEYSPEELTDELTHLLSDAVRIRLIADVTVGSYLSGGLDSSGITALIAKHFNHNVQSFGIRFEESDFDESIYQKQLSSFLNVNHKELSVSNTGIAAHFPEILWHAEKPLLRTAPVPLFLLSKLVSETGLKVILTGEGADEIFGGYNIFKETLIRKFWARKPEDQSRADLITRIYPNIFKNPLLKKSLIKFFAQGLENSNDPLFSHLIRWNNTKRIKMFFSDDIISETKNYDCIEEIRQLLPEHFDSCSTLAKAQFLESKIFLSNYLLSSQGDRVAMAHAVETRPPFLDHRIIEFMSRVPSVWKVLGLNEKHILKKVFSDILPKNIIDRPKNPYRAPIQQSLFSAHNSDLIKNMLSETAIQKTGYFNTKKVAALTTKLHAKKIINEVEGMAIAAILSTQIIDNQYIRNFPLNTTPSLKPDLLIDHRSNASGLFAGNQ
jgi:asparagine synthase (glutamine-hydrolysing)